MNRRIVTWLGAPVMAAGILLGASPAHAGTGVQINSATVSGSSSATLNVTIRYSCDAGGFVRSAAVVAEDRGSGALGLTRFAPNCTGANMTVTIPVSSMNQNGYVAGHTAAVRAELLDGDDAEVVGVITQLTIGNA